MAKVLTYNTCAYCGASSSQSSKLKRCTKCKSVYYCNKQCQKAHYKSHRTICSTDNMLLYTLEIQINTTKILEHERFISFIYPLTHHWAAFDTKHIYCRVRQLRAEVFAIELKLVPGPLENGDNIYLLYDYEKADKVYTYRMRIRFSREDCAAEFARHDRSMLDSIFNKIAENKMSVEFNLADGTLVF